MEIENIKDWKINVHPIHNLREANHWSKGFIEYIPETKCVPDWNLWHWSHWQSCNPGNLGPVPDQISCRAAEKYVCHQMKRKPIKTSYVKVLKRFFEQNSLGICYLHSFCSKTYKQGTYIKSKLGFVFWKNYLFCRHT